MPDMLEALSKFIFTNKYSRYNKEESRREIWEETVYRTRDMHLKKFRNLDKKYRDKIIWAFEKVKERLVVPSMRSLQFGGLPIEVKNERIYNCSVMHIDSIRSFSEAFFLLLCGSGVGFGLSKFFLNRLPDLVSESDKTGIVLTYQVEDTIEGWADSLEALLNCYFKNTAYSGRKIIFDYSKIRKAGEELKTSGGKAPGYKGLKNAHIKIKNILDHIIEDKKLSRLRTIDAYDILMHTSDAVLSGGIRRSATSVIFDKDDSAMMNAKTNFVVEKKGVFEKTGDKYDGYVVVDGIKYNVELKEFEYKLLMSDRLVPWYVIHPQRKRSNISVLLLRETTTLEELKNIISLSRQWGEPGFVFANHPHTLYNPCQPSWAPILTPNGIKKLGDVNIGDKIWSETGWTTITNKWSTGIKDVYKYPTTAGVFYGTRDHKLISKGKKVKAKNCEVVDILSGQNNSYGYGHDPQAVIDGLVIGDGSRNTKLGNQVLLNIGDKDHDYFTYPDIRSLIGEQVSEYLWRVKTTIAHSDLEILPERSIPDHIFYGDARTTTAFLRGLFSANGTVIRSRVTLKTTSKKLREQVQLLLSSIGIASYYTTNRSKKVAFSNGEYTCKESYDINISDVSTFINKVGFLQLYKVNKLVKALNKRRSKSKKSFSILGEEYISTEEVFDITVDNEPHTYWTGGLNVSNCFEIGFIPVTEDGRCGVQFCNLTSQNGAAIDSIEKWREAIEAATIIGTLQATYTDFKYLSNTAKELTDGEALLGVSLTGWLDNPQLLLDREHQQQMSELAVAVNQEWAEILGIRPASRVTCVKPEGTSSKVLKAGSGVHAWHARKYFNRVQVNKLDPVYQYFKAHNPHMCEPSVHSINKTDDIITWPITVPEQSMIKDDIDALRHLRMIKNIQRNWVTPGTTKFNEKDVTHNVSCTVIVKDDEWDMVANYLYKFRHYFSAVSLLSYFGDKMFQQAPNEKVLKEDEERFQYLIDNFVEVDYSQLKEDSDTTKVQETIACGGGQCEL